MDLHGWEHFFLSEIISSILVDFNTRNAKMVRQKLLWLRPGLKLRNLSFPKPPQYNDFCRHAKLTLLFLTLDRISHWSQRVHRRVWEMMSFSEKSLGREIEMWNDFANCFKWDSEFWAMCPSSIHNACTTFFHRNEVWPVKGPKCYDSTISATLLFDFPRCETLGTRFCAVCMKNRCKLLHRQAKQWRW